MIKEKVNYEKILMLTIFIGIFPSTNSKRLYLSIFGYSNFNVVFSIN